MMINELMYTLGRQNEDDFEYWTPEMDELAVNCAEKAELFLPEWPQEGNDFDEWTSDINDIAVNCARSAEQKCHPYFQQDNEDNSPDPRLYFKYEVPGQDECGASLKTGRCRCNTAFMPQKCQDCKRDIHEGHCITHCDLGWCHSTCVHYRASKKRMSVKRDKQGSGGLTFPHFAFTPTEYPKGVCYCGD